MERESNRTEKSSFRDPSGFLFFQDGVLYRQINQSYQEDFDLLKKSGLLNRLIKEKLLTTHREVDSKLAKTKDAYQVIQPERIPFISYPYEWSFSQLKDAALATLKIQKIALEYGMILKDASAYNIQFLDGKPILIDTLSFEKFQEKPWVAYKQFCQHFLAPLALMSYTDIRMGQLLGIYIDGIPLDLTAKLLPQKTKFNPQLLLNIHLHAKSQAYFSDKPQSSRIEKQAKLGKNRLVSIVNGLESAIRGLNWQPKGTEWADYYNRTNYSKKAFKEKAIIVERFLKKAKPSNVWDLGGNTGEFSRIASGKGIPTVSFDIDPAAVEINYRLVKERDEKYILPLVLDLTNPSPAIGWENEERESLIERGPIDTAMALALIHHLAISNNLPLAMIAKFFNGICDFLIIEFVPKEDSQVRRLLATREDIFPNYNHAGFEEEFGRFFDVTAKEQVRGSERIIYLLERKG
jgi:hypothetical protein